MSALDRRRFLGLTAGAAFAQSEKPIRIGIVGVGHRGSYLLTTLLDLPDVQAPAICDINEGTLKHAQDVVEKAGRKRPEGYSSGVEDFRRMMAV
jgi:myo-inositol 2-dehydrogenase / D-chiro-inositol 1-dehydrogenase